VLTRGGSNAERLPEEECRGVISDTQEVVGRWGFGECGA